MSGITIAVLLAADRPFPTSPWQPRFCPLRKQRAFFQERKNPSLADSMMLHGV
jgi:hypothetical protein